MYPLLARSGGRIPPKTDPDRDLRGAAGYAASHHGKHVQSSITRYILSSLFVLILLIVA